MNTTVDVIGVGSNRDRFSSVQTEKPTMKSHTLTTHSRRGFLKLGCSGLVVSTGVGKASAQDSSDSQSDDTDEDIGNLTPQQVLTGGGEDSGDEFGSSIAVSSDGTTAIIGSIADGTSNGGNTGAAYIFTQNDGEWNREQRIVAEDGENADNFGVTVSITGEGNTVLIGANGVNQSKGAVYEFTHEEDRWVQQEKFEFQELNHGEKFGTSTAISDDGRIAFIGAPRVEVEVDNLTYEIDSAFGGDISKTTGAVYLLEKDDRWLRKKDWYVVDTNTLYSDLVNRPDYEDGIRDSGRSDFGQSISLSNNGKTAIVGAKGDGYGSAYLLTRDGNEWSHQNITPDEDVDSEFGSSVSITADGMTSLVTAPKHIDSDGQEVGAAYIIDNKSGNKTRLTFEDTNDSGESTVTQPRPGSGSISSEEQRAVISAEERQSGTPFMFVRNDDGWNQSQPLTLSDESNGDVNGLEIEFFDDGSNILISDRFYDRKGAVFEFEEADQNKSDSSIVSNVPGFGIGSAIIGFLGAAYILSSETG